MLPTADMLKRLRAGDHLSDEELRIVHEYYADLAQRLVPLGDRADLLRAEAARRAEETRGYLSARDPKWGDRNYAIYRKVPRPEAWAEEKPGRFVKDGLFFEDLEPDTNP